MTRIEFGLERTTCACKSCTTNCRFMPGFLIPADLDRMIPVGADPLAWAEKNLLASPGALVQQGAQRFRIPTLVPAVKMDGSCINLSPEGLCRIHEVSPFGCAFFDCGPERNQLSHSGLNAVYEAMFRVPTFSSDAGNLYMRIWTHLAERGLTQKPAEVLRIWMQASLKMEQLKAAGWTQADFAEALKKELESR